MFKHKILVGVAVSFFITQAHALGPENWPKLKPGLIETTMTMNGKPVPASKICMTEETMKTAEKMGKDYQDKSCSKVNYRQQGKTYYVQMVCKDEQGKEMQMNSEATMVSDSHLIVKTKSVVDGKTTKTEQVTKRIGDCDKESAVIKDADGKEVDLGKLLEQIKTMNK